MLKGSLIETMCYWHRDRCIYQRNIIENPEIELDLRQSYCCNLVRNGYIFNKWCWNNWLFIWKKRIIHSYLTPYTTIIKNSRWITDINGKFKKLLLIKRHYKKSEYGRECISIHISDNGLTLKIYERNFHKSVRKINQPNFKIRENSWKSIPARWFPNGQ